MGAQGEESEPVVVRIAEQTKRLIEARRKKEISRKMKSLLKNCLNYDLLRGGGGGGGGGSCDEGESDNQGSVIGGEDLAGLDEAEAERIRKLREVEEEVAAAAKEAAKPNKYESPEIVHLRSIETVDEMYHLADKIIPLASLKR